MDGLLVLRISSQLSRAKLSPVLPRRAFFGACSLQKEVAYPHFSRFWQKLIITFLHGKFQKRSTRGNIGRERIKSLVLIFLLMASLPV